MESGVRVDRWIEPRPWTGAALAGYGARVRATLIDVLIGAAPLALGGLLLVAGLDAVATAVLAAAFGFAVLQPALTSARAGERNGQSWGKQVAGIRIVRDDGRPIGLGYTVVRETLLKTLLLFWIGSLFLLIPLLIDVLWPLWDDQRRALHDTIVGTHVVRA